MNFLNGIPEEDTVEDEAKDEVKDDVKGERDADADTEDAEHNTDTETESKAETETEAEANAEKKTEENTAADTNTESTETNATEGNENADALSLDDENEDVDPLKDDIVDHTFTVFDHRTEGEIHINKRDLDLEGKTGDSYDAYGDTNGDGSLEGAVYGLFAADDIEHLSTKRKADAIINRILLALRRDQVVYYTR